MGYTLASAAHAPMVRVRAAERSGAERQSRWRGTLIEGQWAKPAERHPTERTGSTGACGARVTGDGGRETRDGCIRGVGCRASAGWRRRRTRDGRMAGAARETGGGAERVQTKRGPGWILLVLDACCGYAADLDIKSLYVTDPNAPSVVVFSAPASSTYLMTSFASTA